MLRLAGKSVPVLSSLLALFCAGILPAKANDATPKFFIEKISVGGATWVSKQTVIDSTLLVDHHVYTERDLRGAMSRVVQLGFVLDASFSLRRGSQKDAYELQIQIVEAKPLSLNGDLSWDASTDQHRDPTSSRWAYPYLVGGRLFLGASGMLTVAVADEVVQNPAVVEPASATNYAELSWPYTPQLTIGYTQYRLFDKHVFGSVQVGGARGTITAAGSVTQKYGDSIVGSATLGVRLPRNQTLSIAASHFHRSMSSRSPRDSGWPPPVADDHQNVTLEWRRDTSDDLWRPTRGQRLSLAIGDNRSLAHHDGSSLPTDYSQWMSSYFSRVTAQAIRSLSREHVIGVDGSAEFGTQGCAAWLVIDGDVFSVNGICGGHRLTLNGGIEHAFRPYTGRRVLRNHELWLQTRVDLDWTKFHDYSGHGSYYRTLSYVVTGVSVSTGLRYRNPWGTVDLRIIWNDSLR